MNFATYEILGGDLTNVVKVKVYINMGGKKKEVTGHVYYITNNRSKFVSDTKLSNDEAKLVKKALKDFNVQEVYDVRK